MEIYLEPKKPKTRWARQGFGAQHSSWGEIDTLFQILGCDPERQWNALLCEEFAAATCRRWARALRKVLPSVVLVEIEDRGKYYQGFCPAGREKTALRLLVGKRRGGRLVDVTRLDADDRTMLRDLCRFLEECGGCSVW